MIDAKRTEVNCVEYIAVENKSGLCNGCAFKERPTQCDRVRCTEIVNDGGVEEVKIYKWKKNEQK